MAIRTCVVCRRKEAKGGLLRLAAAPQGGQAETAGSGLVLDALQRFPGRGAYCHAKAECFGSPKLAAQAAASIRRPASASASGGERQKAGVSRGVTARGMLSEAIARLNAHTGTAKQVCEVRERLESFAAELDQAVKAPKNRLTRTRIRL